MGDHDDDGDGDIEFTDDEMAKFDAKLGEAVGGGAPGPFEVLLMFRASPPNAELLQLGLARAGDAVMGQVTREQLKALAGRGDVTSITAFGRSVLR